MTLKPRAGVRVCVSAAGNTVIIKNKAEEKSFYQDSFSSTERGEFLGIRVVRQK